MKILVKAAALIVSVIIAVVVLFGVIISLEKLMLPREYYFYQYHALGSLPVLLYNLCYGCHKR